MGETLTDQQDVVNEYVSFYRTLLGGDQRARSIDLGYLRPWARHIISEEEGGQLLRHVTPDEVKQAVFDIDEAKAPGPDSYSSGRMLKQVNATLLSLIPKELFTGYNQQHLPLRCALKVDIRKAYDTVEWDFLMAVLRLFGFPSLFISWIEECVTMPSFSVCLNGSPHGFFKGARGLWQGDPMSPYLFVLVMELGFADDLLLFSRADECSVHIFKRGLTVFAALSGLHVNPQKSHLIVSRSAAAIRDTLLSILDYQEGFLPLWYLGLPLLASRLSIADYKPLLLNIDSRIKGWDGIMLSFAGRVQLIKSVLLALHVYWAMVFILPKTIIRKIEKRLHLFLGRVPRGWGMPKLLASIWTVSDRSGSWGWRKLVRLRAVIRPFIEYRIGSGSSFLLWHDPWHELGPLITRFPLGPRHSSTPPMAYLGQVIVEGAWSWPPITNMENIEITHSLPIIHGGEDRILCRGKGGTFSSAAAYDVFHPPGPKVGWSSLLLGSFKIPRHRFILLLAILGKLSTLDKPWLHHLGTNCVLCQTATMETHKHLFFLCPFASNCLREVKRLVRFHWPYSHWAMAVHWASRRWRGKHVVNASLRALLASLVYHVWQERNCQIFRQTSRTPLDIARSTVNEIRDLIISTELPHTASSRGLYRLWQIPWPVEGDAAS
ncbi:UNVERIFIED_CONTAM: Retrovirus-related Pol polyprotein from type-2 retrotransposable element R2DM [Sesamum latifolium]|uniref:Retrovirus-related Pol polyprotein from type-2 retrotransposable element R2DM n=1 Tax=Sesamum latifolium TaxID=2727402 RepID=A0AAW2TAJ9_9LAMI